MSTQYSEIELSDQEIEEYLDVALSAKTVTPDERKKLAPLLKFYAKKPKPFTACVKDNRKRFGPKTEAYCAVLKDLIMGTTKWRHGGNHTAKGAAMSQELLSEMYELDPPEGFGHWLAEIELSEIEDIIGSDEDTAPEDGDPATDLSEVHEQIMAEMFFAANSPESTVKVDQDGLHWKTILREGKWKYSPGPGAAPQAKPITVVKDGESDPSNKIISMAELKKNFEDGVIEHVTIPTSHADSVLENTGFIKKLRFGVDEEGRNVLEAGHSFTEPDVKDKAERGTIANTSAGILFDYIHKESGKKFRSVLAHVALTNRPWLNGMKPFGVNASDDVSVMSFSEELNDETANAEEVTSMSEVTYDFSALGFDSEEELKSALEERAQLKASQRERDVADLCQKWQGEGKTPALVAEAKAILMSDEGGSTGVNLSEDGKTVALTASDIVKRLVEKATSVDLTQEVVTEENLSEELPNEDEEVELSQEVRAIEAQLFFSGLTGKEARAEAIRRVEAAETK